MASFVLATPARNEIDNLPSLLQGIDQQTLKPTIWLIVDDGSTDGSREWLATATESRPWLVVVDAPEQADEYLGAHVARIKRWGLEQAQGLASERGQPAQFAGILDADIVVPPDHYRALIDRCEADPGLGIVSSVVVSKGDQGTKLDRFQREDSARGGTQLFRRECLEAIGGLPPWPGFDGAANVKARAKGFSTRCFFEIVAVQQRETAARFGHDAGYARKGRYAWFLGVHPLMALARGAAYSMEAPHSAGYHFLKAYFTEAARRKPRCPDPEVRAAYGARRIGEAALALLGKGSKYAK
jgi:glycosyltransferase involved in cell wall biosynthesis